LSVSKMSEQKHFTLAARLKSFVFAFNGIKLYFKSQHNVWVHLLISFAVIIFGFLFQINLLEWCLVCLAMGLVLSAEGFNSALELLCDVVHPEKKKQIGHVKDIAAGAVLISAIFAALTGSIIFVPKIFALFITKF
jgi:diacylglycerol kinase (ATP)